MPTAIESRCCSEIPKIKDKAGEAGVRCIIEHPGFAGGCLNVWALEIAYLQYRQEYGSMRQKNIHELVE